MADLGLMSCGVEVAAAVLALVAVCALVMAVRALACDISVGEELSRLLVVILLCGLLYQLAVLIQLPEKV